MLFTGDKDIENAPESDEVVSWEYFNSDMYSTDRSYKEVEEIFDAFGHKKVDLRPYMIENPYVCHHTDKLPKVLEMFRNMHLRALPVLDP